MGWKITRLWLMRLESDDLTHRCTDRSGGWRRREGSGREVFECPRSFVLLAPGMQSSALGRENHFTN